MHTMYTDRQLQALAQIGYLELARAYESRGGTGKRVKLSALLTEKDRQSLALRGGDEEEYSQWNMMAVCDTNAVNGFYACVLETAPGCAVVCFRGSDPLVHGYTDLRHDWVEADLGLLNAAVTEQQREAERFLQANRSLLRQYRRLTIVGHSLGGNLAEFAAIRSVKYGLDGLMERCVSLDGPGFSNEFISQNKAILRYVCAKMRHDRWSFVGALLNDLPGVAYRFVDVRHVSKKDQYNMVTRHDLKYLKVDENGCFAEGQQDLLSVYFSRLSRQVEGMPKQKGDKIKVALSDLALKAGQMGFALSGVLQTIRDALHRGKDQKAKENKKNDGTGASA